MTKIRRMKAPRNSLGMFERMRLARNGRRDGADKRLSPLQAGYGAIAHMSPFISSEIEAHLGLRDDIIKYYVIYLDCRNLDKELIRCDKTEECKLLSCAKCRHCFSDAVTMINNEANNVIASLDVPEPALAEEKADLSARLAGEPLPPHLTQKMLNRLGAIDKALAELECEKTRELVHFLNSKVRLIEMIQKLLEAHFRIHALRLKHYWKAASKQDKSLPPVLPPDDALFALCHQTPLGAMTQEYETALELRSRYTQIYQTKFGGER